MRFLIPSTAKSAVKSAEKIEKTHIPPPGPIPTEAMNMMPEINAQIICSAALI